MFLSNTLQKFFFLLTLNLKESMEKVSCKTVKMLILYVISKTWGIAARRRNYLKQTWLRGVIGFTKSANLRSITKGE